MTDHNKDNEDDEGHEDQDVEGYEDQSVEAELGPTLFETAIGLILGVSLLVYGHSNDIINLNFNNLGIAQMFVQYGLVLLLVPFVCTIAFVVLFRSLKWLISKSSLGNNSDDVNNPRVFMYIIAWVLAHFLVNLFNKLTSFIVIDDFIDDPDPFFSMLLPAFFSSGIVILVYNFFNNLNMKKVMIYFYIGALLGIGAEFYLAYIISSTDAMLELPNADWEFIRNAVLHKVFLGSWERYANIIGPYVLYLFIVRYYYIKKPDRWY